MDKEPLTHEQLVDFVRSGGQLYPDTPGLGKAAEEVIRPHVEGMLGKEIIYRCRVPWLMRVDELEVDSAGFMASATPLREIRDSGLSLTYDEPLCFGGRWGALTMRGLAVSMMMVTDHFYTDPARHKSRMASSVASGM